MVGSLILSNFDLNPLSSGFYPKPTLYLNLALNQSQESSKKSGHVPTMVAATTGVATARRASLVRWTPMRVRPSGLPPAVMPSVKWRARIPQKKICCHRYDIAFRPCFSSRDKESRVYKMVLEYGKGK